MNGYGGTFDRRKCEAMENMCEIVRFKFWMDTNMDQEIKFKRDPLPFCLFHAQLMYD